MESNNRPSSSKSKTSRCAACTEKRQSCNADCTFAPFFPPSSTDDFRLVRKIFGAKNVKKTIDSLNSQDAKQLAVESMIYEARVRTLDPVGGCLKIIRELEREIEIVRAQLSSLGLHPPPDPSCVPPYNLLPDSSGQVFGPLLPDSFGQAAFPSRPPSSRDNHLLLPPLPPSVPRVPLLPYSLGQVSVHRPGPPPPPNNRPLIVDENNLDYTGEMFDEFCGLKEQ